MSFAAVAVIDPSMVLLRAPVTRIATRPPALKVTSPVTFSTRETLVISDFAAPALSVSEPPTVSVVDSYPTNLWFCPASSSAEAVIASVRFVSTCVRSVAPIVRSCVR